MLPGVCGTDPSRLMPAFLREFREKGFDSMQNFPTVGLLDGVFRQNLEETGMGYDLEIEMIELAHEIDMLTCPYMVSEEDAVAMAGAAADVLLPNTGLTTEGDRARRQLWTWRGPPGAGKPCTTRPEGQPGRDRPLPRRSDRRAA